MEHITTSEAADYVTSADQNLAATVTVHHLMLNRNHMLAGGIRPHYYCLPILKRDTHQAALVDAATSGDPRFFLGTDSAPHLASDKESPCGCAGCFTSPNALACLATIFEQEGALEKLEGFTSVFGAQFYGLALNETQITLNKTSEPARYARKMSTVEGDVAIFDPGCDLHWSVART